MPTLSWRLRSAWKTSSVSWVSFEPSMSRRTKPPVSFATSRIPPTFSRQRSREISCPIDDILIEMFLSIPAGMRRRSSLEASVARVAAPSSSTSSPSLSKVALMPFAWSRSPARTASCGRSPATKRRAKIVRGFIAFSRGP